MRSTYRILNVWIAVTTSYSDIAHLLRRAGFGGLPAEINALTQYDLATVVSKVLDVSQAPPVVVPAEVLDATAPAGDRYNAFIWFWLDRMATTPAPIAEKMTLFWHGHLTSGLQKTDIQNMWSQIDTYRSLGLAGFETLCQAAAISPAMLQYLDNESNIAVAPNENFARELMELFTVGVNQYSQSDVHESARAWTGHGLSSDKHTYTFSATQHDATNKTIFGVTKNWNGPDVISALVSGVKKQTCAQYMARKLWEFFAYENPSASLVSALAGAFVSSNMNITELLRAIFMRPEFYTAQSRHGHVRSPVELVVATMRYTGLRSISLNPQGYLSAAGQNLLNPPNVAGWKNDEYWISDSTMWIRSNLAHNINGLVKGLGILAGTSVLSPQTAAQRAFDAFGIEEVSGSTRTAIENYVIAERAAKGAAEQQNLIQLGMLCPEFQAG